MKIRLIIIAILISSCKVKKDLVESTKVQTVERNCVLKNLNKTINYENEIEKYTTIYKDTLIEFESFKTDSAQYKTVLDLKKSERFLWLLAIKEKYTDSLLINCMSETKWVESKFLLDKCQLEMNIEEFDNNGMPTTGVTKRINYIN